VLGGALVSLGAEQEVNCFACFINGPIQVPPFANTSIRQLLPTPLITQFGCLTERKQQLGSPPVRRRMVDRHCPLGHHFF
jgi:hypothetical protein